MPKFFRRRSEKTGLPPGTLVHIGEKKIDETRIRIIDYDEEHLEEKEVKTPEECFVYKDKPTVTWINIDGLHDVNIIEKVGKHFGLHPLLLEDILNTEQRPKIEDYGSYIFIVLKMLYYDEEENMIMAEQMSLILLNGLVISFQERVGDVFEPARERIRHGKGHIRKAGADYLFYTLIDAVVDNYFVMLEKFGDIIEDLEEELVSDPTQRTLYLIHVLRREMLFLRKSIWPLREVIVSCERAESSLIHASTVTYFRDVYDHVIQVIDTAETFREMISGMLDTYLSSNSNRMSEVMKVLTMVATIFIPLTFIAGIYGMNFDYMPELHKKWGYPVALLLMFIVAILMVVYFRRKRWI
ncbi:MAG TPA: magnesium/cobalt transporter CorA [Thermodesulfobacteriota bacterium]|nr:magnesium/cobalt transporter CorA [Thermodesulfobacteriota bacterium]